MIKFIIITPGSLSLFGEHTESRLMASIDLHTTLTFKSPLPHSTDIKIIFPQINLRHKKPLQEYLNFFKIYARNRRLLEGMNKFNNLSVFVVRSIGEYYKYSTICSLISPTKSKFN